MFDKILVNYKGIETFFKNFHKTLENKNMRLFPFIFYKYLEQNYLIIVPAKFRFESSITFYNYINFFYDIFLLKFHMELLIATNIL